MFYIKKFGTTFILLLALIAGGFLISNYGKISSNSNNGSSVLSAHSEQSPNFNQQKQQNQAIVPITFSIPSLGITNAQVESVGMDAQGNMGVPKDPNDVAWYNLGFKPGDNGSAVIAGHLDKMDLSPAVFWNLMKLNNGDTVQVTDTSGKTLTFKVVDKESYPYTNFPLQKVFNTTGKPMLNLITCQGIYDRNAASYTERGVVYTELVE